jgi:hypothetical protein
MKVNIGPYTRWIGSYQIADWLFFWHKERVITGDEKFINRWDYRLKDKLGDWLANSWVNNFCAWLDSFKERKIKVHIDYYDTWSMDHTLALIIHPMLVQLQMTKHGSPCVDPEDAPPIGKGEDDGYGSDTKLHERWDWVLSEMIWAFEQLKSDDTEFTFYDPDTDKWDMEGRDKHEERIKNGLRLFGKYYRGLWD